MNRLLKAFLSGVLVCFTGSALATVTMTEISGSVELSLGSAGFYKATDDVTLTLTGSATDGVGTLAASFWIPDSTKTITVDASGVTGLTTLVLTGSLRGDGTFRVGAGVTTVRFGVAPSDLKNVVHLPVLEAPLEMAEASGSVELTGGVTLCRFPSADYTIAEGAVIAPFSAGLFDGTDTLTLEDYDLVLTQPTTIKKDCTIKVKTGRTLYLRPSSQVYAPDSSIATSFANWAGGNDMTFDFDVSLEGGTLESQVSGTGDTYRGSVTGTGDVMHRGAQAYSLQGQIAFTGKLTCCPRKDEATAIVLSAEAGSDFSETDIVIASDLSTYPRQIRFASATAPLTVRSLSGSYRNELNVLSVGAGVSVTFLSNKSWVTFTGDGDGAAVVITPHPTDSATMIVTPGINFTLTGWKADDTLRLLDNGEAPVWTLGSTASSPIPVPAVPDGVSDAVLDLDGGFVLGDTANVAKIIVEPDADITVKTAGTTLPVFENRGGTVSLQAKWQDDAALWLDVSKAQTLSNAALQVQKLGISATVDDRAVYEWLDCRETQRSYRIRSTRYDTKASLNQGVFPRVYQDSTDGLPYLSWWDVNRTRTSMAGSNYNGNAITLSAKCIISVFGSQLGGGCATFCEKDARLARVASSVYTSKITASTVPASTPICLDATVSVRTNGVAVTGSETGFNGGWQLVTLSSDTTFSLQGIGHAKTPDGGDGNFGQNYREIVVFAEVPSAETIREVEAYLAKKWGLPYGNAPSAPVLTMSGTGSVSLAEDTQQDGTGYYTGTVDLNGHRFAIADGLLPITASEVPSANRLVWVDPSLEGAVVMTDDANRPDEVKMIYTRDNAGLLTAKGSYYLTSPYDVPESGAAYDTSKADRRVRYTGGWLDFLNGYDETAGNMLSFQQLPYAEMKAFNSTAKQFDNVRGGFFALDTSRGGGSFMLTMASGSAGAANRIGKRVASSPIWELGKDSTVGFDTYLDGTAVDGLTQGFNGRREVLSFNETNGVSVTDKVTGYCEYSTASVANMEIMGEWILYSQPLADADRANVEAYLMKKWLGRLRTGYVESRDLTVTGSGVLAVTDRRQMPQVAAGFTGAVELTANRHAFHLPRTGTEATDAFKIGQTLQLPQDVTIDLTLDCTAPGRYLLMQTAGLPDGVRFTLGTVTTPSYRDVVLTTEDGSLYATVASRGLILMVH